MGSGCNNSKFLSKCLDPISSDCVLWHGEAIDALGICQGDTITEVVSVILTKLQLIAEGKGIKLNDLIIGCADLDLLYQNSDKELSSILQIILDNTCSLQSQINALTIQVNNPTTAITVDLKCLPNTAVTRSLFDQALVDKLCALQAQVDQLQTQIPSNTSITTVVTDILISKLQSCNGGITVTGTGVNRVLNFHGIIPVGGKFFTNVDPSKFDATGLGMDNWCGYAYCNGKNGTEDMGGLAAAQGKTKGSPYTGYLQGEIKGTETTTLLPENVPNHTHSIVDPGHRHNVKTGAAPGIAYGQYISNTSNPSSNYSNSFINTTDVVSNTTGVSVGGVNGATAQPFTNLQPTLFGAWIQRIS